MIKEIGQFAVSYSEDFKHIIIAFIPRPSGLSTHVALFNRLKGVAIPTGDYSYLTFNNTVCLGIHFENNISEEYLIHALS